MTKWVYTFGDGKAEGDASMRNLLGGKAGNPLQHLRLAALDDFDLLVFLVQLPESLQFLVQQ